MIRRDRELPVVSLKNNNLKERLEIGILALHRICICCNNHLWLKTCLTWRTSQSTCSRTLTKYYCFNSRCETSIKRTRSSSNSYTQKARIRDSLIIISLNLALKDRIYVLDQQMVPVLCSHKSNRPPLTKSIICKRASPLERIWQLVDKPSTWTWLKSLMSPHSKRSNQSSISSSRLWRIRCTGPATYCTFSASRVMTSTFSWTTIRFTDTQWPSAFSPVSNIKISFLRTIKSLIELEAIGPIETQWTIWINRTENQELTVSTLEVPAIMSAINVRQIRQPNSNLILRE